MFTSGFRRPSAAREWLVAFMAYALLVAPFGCELQGGLLPDPDGGGDGTVGAGLFINSDLADPLVIAGKNDAGDGFFVYGARAGDGAVSRVDSIIVRERSGAESFITFELGRPTHVEGADGSYAHIAYTNVTATALTASVDLFIASSGEKQTFGVTIDLEQALAEVADIVRQVTGKSLETDFEAKSSTAQVRITLFSPLFALVVAPFVALVSFMTLILGQVLAFMVQAVVQTLQGVLLVIFAPLFLIGQLVGGALFNIRVQVPGPAFTAVPDRPTVVLR